MTEECETGLAISQCDDDQVSGRAGIDMVDRLGVAVRWDTVFPAAAQNPGL